MLKLLFIIDVIVVILILNFIIIISLACTRRKLYLGIVDEPIQMTSSLINQPNQSNNITSGDIFEQYLQQYFMSAENQEMMYIEDETINYVYDVMA